MYQVLAKLNRIETMLDEGIGTEPEVSARVPNTSYRGVDNDYEDFSKVTEVKVPIYRGKTDENVLHIEIMNRTKHALPDLTKTSVGNKPIHGGGLFYFGDKPVSTPPLPGYEDKIYAFTHTSNLPYDGTKMSLPTLDDFMIAALLGNTDVCKIAPTEKQKDLQYLKIYCGGSSAANTKNQAIACKVLALEHPYDKNVHEKRIKELYDVVNTKIQDTALFRKFCEMHAPEIDLQGYSVMQLIHLTMLYQLYNKLSPDDYKVLADVRDENDACKTVRKMSDLADLSHTTLAFLGSKDSSIDCKDKYSSELAFLGFYCHDTPGIGRHFMNSALKTHNGWFGTTKTENDSYDKELAEYYRKNWFCVTDYTESPKRLAMFHWLKNFVHKLIGENPKTVFPLYQAFCAAAGITGFKPTEIAPYLGFFVYIMGMKGGQVVLPKVESARDPREVMLKSLDDMFFITGYENDKDMVKHKDKYEYLSSSAIKTKMTDKSEPMNETLYKFGPGWYFKGDIGDKFAQLGKHLKKFPQTATY